MPRMIRPVWQTVMLLAVLQIAAAPRAIAQAAPSPTPAPATKLADNLDFWLRQAQPATSPAQPAQSQGAARENTPATQPLAPATQPAAREDALPGALELSDGKIIGGYLYTTEGKDWELYVEQDKVIRRIPFLAVLSIAAKVEEEKMELEWRWKEMGTPEKVYTGRSYPTRRTTWIFKLIDGATVTGTIKGQPLWIDSGGKTLGPLVLGERSKGEMGQKLGDLIYVKYLVVSKRVMEQAKSIAN